MKKAASFFAACISAFFFAGCSGTPAGEQKTEFQNLVARLENIQVLNGMIDDHKTFYSVCEKLSERFFESEYGRDMVKDMLLTGNTVPVRAAGAVVLERIGSEEDALVLISALDDRSSEVADKAYRSLVKLTREDFGKDRMKWLVWWKSKKEVKHD